MCRQWSTFSSSDEKRGYLSSCCTFVILYASFSEPVLFSSMGGFLFYSEMNRSLQFSLWSDLDDFMPYVFKCTTFCSYWASNSAIWWESMHRSVICLAKPGCCFGSWNGSGAGGAFSILLFSFFFLIWICSVPHMQSKRLLSEPLPRLFLPSSLSPACTFKIFLKFSPLAWPWIVLCPNIDPLKHSKLLADTQTTSALRHLRCLLQSMPLGR